MSFLYTPLSDTARCVRLFSIVAGEDEDVLRILLHGEHKLGSQDCPSYAALSYAWGPSSPLHTIKLNHQTIQVRGNLWMFLRQLRRSSGHYLLWSDALCINQEDVVEKNAQVRMMDQIYSRATAVLVWLGGEVDQSDRLLDAANTKSPRSPLSSPWVAGYMDSAESGLNLLPALYSLCVRPYWARTWILQELYLARGEVIILCGSNRTTLSKLQVLFETTMNDLLSEGEAYPLIWRPGMEVPDFWNTLSTCTLRWLSTKKPQHQTYLEELLTKHKHSLCSDPRDKVFALQNMTANSLVPVDYSMDPHELYWTVLARCQSSDIRFARNVQEALKLTTLAIRDCPMIGPYQDPQPILSGDVFFRSAPTTPLTRVGTISTIEEFHNSHVGDEVASNVRFYMTVSLNGPTRRKTASGIASCEVQPGDLVYSLEELPEVLLILRWHATSQPQHIRGAELDEDLSAFLSIRTFQCFGIAVGEMLPDRLIPLSHVLCRMNLTSTRLVTKGIRPISPIDSVPAWESATNPCLVLNRAALMGTLEYLDNKAGIEVQTWN